MMPIAPEWALDVANLFSPSPWHPILGKWAFGDIRLDGIEWVAAPWLDNSSSRRVGLENKSAGSAPVGVVRALPVAPRVRPAPADRASARTSGLLQHFSGFRRALKYFSGTSASTWGRRARREGWPHAAKMPFWWLRSAVGPLKSFRAPVRLSIAALVCWSVCAALGMASVVNERRAPST
jgi:hypothetical protein